MPLILQMRDITKTFFGRNALSDVCLEVEEGEIHAICGENGAGKSTLMNVLSGVYPFGSYEGHIYYDGKECRFNSVRDSERLGIVIIHQEFALVPVLSIAENIFLGNEPAHYGIIDQKRMIQDALVLMKRVGLNESPYTLVADIGVGKQQLVEIAKALSKKAQLLILDEPTACLSDEDSETLLELLREFRRQGITSILISHKLDEIRQVADRITIIREGQTIETINQTNVSEDRIVTSMVGRTLDSLYPERLPRIGEVIFEVKDWFVSHPHDPKREIIKNLSLFVRRGEIVGLAGLMGAGRTEFAMSVFGQAYGSNIQGKAYIHGEEVDLSTVQKAISKRLAYVTEDRKTYGLNLADHIRHNMTITNLPRISKLGVIDWMKELFIADDYSKKTKIRSSSIHQAVSLLSGGNQQKVLIAKWLFTNPDIIIFDEPTRGVDVGAKYELYTIINQLAEEGKAILFISSDMSELLGVSDRIYVLNEGGIADEMLRCDASQEKIMRAIIAKDKEKTYEH